MELLQSGCSGGRGSSFLKARRMRGSSVFVTQDVVCNLARLLDSPALKPLDGGMRFGSGMIESERDRCIYFDVGGSFFKTTRNTLAKQPTSYLYKLACAYDSSNEEPIFIDRDPTSFSIILNYFRYGASCLFDVDFSGERGLGSLLIADAQFYQLDEVTALLDRCNSCKKVFLLSQTSCEKEMHSSDRLRKNESLTALRLIGVTDAHMSTLKSWIFSRTKVFDAFVLKYEASKDGFSPFDFHRCCDHVSRLLVVIKSASGYLFGGFSVVAFDSFDEVNHDSESFLFTLVNPHEIAPVSFSPRSDISVGPACNPNSHLRYGMDGILPDLGLSNAPNLSKSMSVVGNDTGGWSFFGKNSGYVDVTGLGGALFTGGIVKADGSCSLERIDEILAFQV